MFTIFIKYDKVLHLIENIKKVVQEEKENVRKFYK